MKKKKEKQAGNVNSVNFFLPMPNGIRFDAR